MNARSTVSWWMTTLLSLVLLCSAIGCGGGSSSGNNPAPPKSNAVPTIASLSPASTSVGSAALTLTINGSGFVNGATVYWNGTAKATSFVSSTQLQTSIAQADIASAATVSVKVNNPAPGGGDSASTNFSITNPAPVVSSVSPSPITQSHVGTTLTVTGTGFVPSSLITWNGTNRSTTFVSSTQLQTTLANSDVATLAAVKIGVHNDGPGGGDSAPVDVQLQNAVPAITSLSPSSTQAGGAALTLTVNGSGFVNGATVYWNGTAKATTFVSSTQLQASVSQADIASAATVSVKVNNPAPGGGDSADASFSVTNPSPVVNSVSPSPITTSHIGTTLTVTGTGFVPSSLITWNGTNRSTTYVSRTQLQTTLTSADFASLATVRIGVHNDGPGGGDSAPVDLQPQNAAPTIASLSPSLAKYGTAGFTLTVNGAGFVPASEVHWNGAARSTTFVSSTQLTAAIPADDIATQGTAQVSVYTPGPGGGTTVALAFAVRSIQTPVLNSLSPATAYVNSPDITLVIYGTSLQSGATAQFNGEDLVTTYSWNNTLTATIPAARLKVIGTNSITVKNAGAGAGISNSLSFQVAPNPAPTLTYMYPASAPVGGTATITVNGTGFVSGSVLRWNGADLPTTYVSSGQLTADIPATKLQSFGNNDVTVFSPAPGGGTSTGLTFSTYLNLPSNDVAVNPTTGLLYASIPSSAGPTLGNSIVSIDPYTGNLGTPIWVGSEPGKIAISDDGSTLWVVLNNASSVRKVDLRTKTATAVQVYFPGDSHTGLYQINDLRVMPGTTDTVAVTSGNVVSILDNDVKRSKTGFASRIAFDTSGTRLYGMQDYGGYAILTVDNTGIASTQNVSLWSSWTTDLRYDSGRVYLTNGQILTAGTGALAGTLAKSGPVAPDSTLGRAFVLTSGSGSGYDRVTAYDTNTFTPITSMPVGGVIVNSGYPTLLRWGQDGLAIRTPTQLYLLRSKIVRDLSSSATDLSVSTTAPATATTGTNLSFTVNVKNEGANGASKVSVIDTIPQGTIFASATPSQGECSGTAVIRCNFGTLASGASATLAVVVTPATAGTITNTATVSALEPDSSLENNTAVSAVTVSGDAYYPQPVLSTISPAAVSAGANTFTLTVDGTGFTSASTVRLNGTSLPTTFVSATQLTATVDSSYVTTIGWTPIMVSNPTPGGGNSSPLPLTVYKTVSLDTGDLVFDPFTRKLWASVPSTATQATGNSLIEIDPASGALGTPVNIGSEPYRMSLSDDGRYLYTVLTGSKEVRRMDVPTRTPGARFSTVNYYNGAYAAGDVAVMPGHPDTVAASGYSDAIQIYDVVGSTGTTRAYLGSVYAGDYLGWTDSSHLFSYDSGSSPSKLHRFEIGSTTARLVDETNVSGFGNDFVADNGLLYSGLGGVVDPSPVYPAPPKLLGRYSSSGAMAVDSGYGRVFYFIDATYPSDTVGVTVFDKANFLQLDSLTLPNLGLPRGAGGDLVRWGRDGLAFRTYDRYGTAGNGRLVLLRGPLVQPNVQTRNAPPSLTALSPSSAAAGTGNTYVTVTGSGFIPGAVVYWNGQERTTVFVNATTLRAAIPTADLAAAGTASVTVANPNSASSSAVTFTIN